MSPARRVVSEAGLGLVLALLSVGVVGVVLDRGGPASLPFATAASLHVWLTVLDGGWTTVRRWTWRLLVLAWMATAALNATGFPLPWGQAVAWFATAILVIDVGLAAVPLLRARSARGKFVFAAFTAVLAVVLAWPVAPPQPVAGDNPLVTPVRIVPPLPALPLFALLRCVPGKLAGAALAAAAGLIPIAAPWMRAERFRSGAAGVAWLLLCLALLAVWVALGWLGGSLPDDGVVAATRLLAAGYFAFFLVAAPLVARATRRRSR